MPRPVRDWEPMLFNLSPFLAESDHLYYTDIGCHDQDCYRCVKKKIFRAPAA